MRERYSKRLGVGELATVLLSKRRGSWHIDRVTVPPAWRGRGVSRMLMEQVLAAADLEGATLTLEAHSCGGLAQHALVEYYERLGFRRTGRRGPFGPRMSRAPRRQQVEQGRRTA